MIIIDEPHVDGESGGGSVWPHCVGHAPTARQGRCQSAIGVLRVHPEAVPVADVPTANAAALVGHERPTAAARLPLPEPDPAGRMLQASHAERPVGAAR